MYFIVVGLTVFVIATLSVVGWRENPTVIIHIMPILLMWWMMFFALDKNNWRSKATSAISVFYLSILGKIIFDSCYRLHVWYKLGEITPAWADGKSYGWPIGYILMYSIGTVVLTIIIYWAYDKFQDHQKWKKRKAELKRRKEEAKLREAKRLKEHYFPGLTELQEDLDKRLT
jgi:hypothetical protein